MTKQTNQQKQPGQPKQPHLTSGLLGQIIHGPVATVINQTGNALLPVHMPDPETCFQLWVHGFSTFENLQTILRVGSGIELQEGGLWGAVLDLHRYWLDPETVLSIGFRDDEGREGAARGGTTDVPFYDLLKKRSGLAIGSTQRQIVATPVDWNAEEIRQIVALNNYGIPRYYDLLRSCGYTRGDDLLWATQLIQPPTYLEVVELAQRDLLISANGTADERGTPEEQRREFNRLMTLEGYTDQKVIDYLWALRLRLPTEGELIEAAVKNAFVGPLAKILRLDDEYDEQPQFIVGTDRLGLSGSPFISLADMKAHIQNHRLKAGNERRGVVLQQDESPEQADERALEFFNAQDKSLLTWAQVFWRAHWVNLSPAQIYNCLHRHRVIDITKPGGAAAKARYERELLGLQFAGLDSAENRYAIACRYAMTTQPNGQPGLGFGRNPNVPPVTQDIVDTVLRANDYAPLFRANLSAISYNVLRLVDIRRMVQVCLRNEEFATQAIGWVRGMDVAGMRESLGLPETTPPLTVFVQAWAREQYLDRGQTPDASQSLSVLAINAGRATNSVIARATNPAGRRRWVRLLERAYRVGVITRDNFARLIGQVDNVSADNEVYADVYAEEDLISDDFAQSQLTAEDDLIVAEDYADDAVQDDIDNSV